MANKTITLAHSRGTLDGGRDHGKTIDQWRVVRVVDSLSYTPNQYLKKDEVESLCRSVGWKVNIVADKEERT